MSAAVASLMLGASAPPDGPVAAVFPPWWQASDVFAAAGSAGRIVRMGGMPFIVIVAREGDRLADRLRAAGAMLVLDPIVIGGCSPRPASV